MLTKAWLASVNLRIQLSYYFSLLSRLIFFPGAMFPIICVHLFLNVVEFIGRIVGKEILGKVGEKVIKEVGLRKGKSKVLDLVMKLLESQNNTNNEKFERAVRTYNEASLGNDCLTAASNAASEAYSDESLDIKQRLLALYMNFQLKDWLAQKTALKQYSDIKNPEFKNVYIGNLFENLTLCVQDLHRSKDFQDLYSGNVFINNQSNVDCLRALFDAYGRRAVAVMRQYKANQSSVDVKCIMSVWKFIKTISTLPGKELTCTDYFYLNLGIAFYPNKDEAIFFEDIEKDNYVLAVGLTDRQTNRQKLLAAPTDNSDTYKYWISQKSTILSLATSEDNIFACLRDKNHKVTLRQMDKNLKVIGQSTTKSNQNPTTDNNCRIACHLTVASNDSIVCLNTKKSELKIPRNRVKSEGTSISSGKTNHTADVSDDGSADSSAAENKLQVAEDTSTSSGEIGHHADSSSDGSTATGTMTQNIQSEGCLLRKVKTSKVEFYTYQLVELGTWAAAHRKLLDKNTKRIFAGTDTNYYVTAEKNGTANLWELSDGGENSEALAYFQWRKSTETVLYGNKLYVMCFRSKKKKFNTGMFFCEILLDERNKRWAIVQCNGLSTSSIATIDGTTFYYSVKDKHKMSSQENAEPNSHKLLKKYLSEVLFKELFGPEPDSEQGRSWVNTFEDLGMDTQHVQRQRSSRDLIQELTVKNDVIKYKTAEIR